MGSKAILCSHWADGCKGTIELAHEVVKLIESGKAKYKPLYADELPLVEKVRTIAKEIYRADDIASIRPSSRSRSSKPGFGHYPVCIAKTQYSFSTDPSQGCADGPWVPMRDVRLRPEPSSSWSSAATS